MHSDGQPTFKPLVSVLMTAYNRERYIAEAIESVLASSYHNFELIVSDDCSSDGTWHIVKTFRVKDKRIRAYQNRQNLGDYPNRNTVASYAYGKYLKYVDSDDCIHPEALSIMVKMMESFPSAGFGLCDVSEGIQETYPLLLDAREAYWLHYFKRPVFFASPGLAIFQRDAFNSVGGFQEKRMIGDFEMWHRLSLHCPLLLLPSDLYWTRKHNEQEVSAQNKYIPKYEKIKIKYLFAKQSPLTLKEANAIIRKRKSTLLKIFVRKLLTGEVKEAVVRLKVYFFYLKHFRKLKAQA